MAPIPKQVPLYQQSGALVDELLAWRPAAPTLPGRLEELYIHMCAAHQRGATHARTMPTRADAIPWCLRHPLASCVSHLRDEVSSPPFGRYELNIVGAKDVALAQAWISDLLRLGYRFPAVRPGPAGGANPW